MDIESVRKITCVGSGSVASSLLPTLYGAGYKISQVCSRNLKTAQPLAKMVGASCTSNLAELDPTVDFYIIAVADDEIENVLAQAKFGNGIVLHMSGSTPMSVFANHGIEHYGVLYPLQSFSRQHTVNFARVPLYVEACSKADLAAVIFMARKLSVEVFNIDSEKRMLLHIAAVFACNFSTHLLTIAAQLLQNVGLSYASLKPLVRETFERTLMVENPGNIQTGPAIRGDQRIVARHMEALASQPLMQQIYRLLSESIREMKAEN
jgi:predicted short-subunit dehydrogenase-like oxidoreductase (DUF2520 family)